jgi:hypothetical protein
MTYEKTPAAPYRRLLESAEVSDASKAELTRRKGLQDPITLNNGLNGAVEKRLKLNRGKAKIEQVSCQGAGRAEAV